MRDTYELFKESLFIHFGGDEVDTSCWDSRPEIKEFMEKNGIPDYVALETYYR
jgi:N-acetyl-beta-hexosaminidase